MARELSDTERRTVELAKAQAAAYVWGRYDAGDEQATDSREFAEAYAARYTRHFAESQRNMLDLEAAHQEYRKNGVITTGI
ncbi:MAG TPA: hypothetical protein VH373_22210 [Jatrophihabitantaceae bacterium]|jgi:hypothetical protein